MNRLLRLGAAGALVAGAAGFVRSTTVAGRPDQGKPLFWRRPSVTYRVNASGFRSVPGCASPGAAAAQVRQSFPTWSSATRAGQPQACTDFRFVDGGDTSRTELGYDATPGASNVNLVVVREGLCGAITSDPDCQQADPGACVERHNCWSHDPTSGPGGTLALTTVTYVPDTGELLDADLELNGWNGDPLGPTGWYFTCVDPPAPVCASPGFGDAGCIEIDVGNTVTHEAGHMLGLDHVCDPSYPKPYDACPRVATPEGPLPPVMAPTAVPGDTDKRQLKPDDVEGVCTIYPAVSGGCGCRSGGGGALALLGLVLALWRRRVRQRTTAPA